MDRSKPPICPGLCDRCGQLARGWECATCVSGGRPARPHKPMQVCVNPVPVLPQYLEHMRRAA